MKSIFVFCSFFISTAGSAQTTLKQVVVLNGRISDANTGARLENADLCVVNSVNDTLFQIKSKSNGKFDTISLPIGELYYIHVGKENYFTKSVKLNCRFDEKPKDEAFEIPAEFDINLNEDYSIGCIECKNYIHNNVVASGQIDLEFMEVIWRNQTEFYNKQIERCFECCRNLHQREFQLKKEFLDTEKEDSISAKSIKIEGFIIDYSDSSKLSGVIVEIYKHDYLFRIDSTDEYGNYRFYGLYFNRGYKLIYRKEGYVSNQIYLNLDCPDSLQNFSELTVNNELMLFKGKECKDYKLERSYKAAYRFHREYSKFYWDFEVKKMYRYWIEDYEKCTDELNKK